MSYTTNVEYNQVKYLVLILGQQEEFCLFLGLLPVLFNESSTSCNDRWGFIIFVELFLDIWTNRL